MNASDLAQGLRRAARAVVRTARSGTTRTQIIDPPQARTASYSYEPVHDDQADPGEVAWAWVTFEEDAKRGKDRPVLVVGRDGERLLALQLTSKDHDLDAEQEAAAGRYWIDIGSGAWDRHRRPSEARVNRLLRLDPAVVRRPGVPLDRELFARVMEQVRRYFPEP